MSAPEDDLPRDAVELGDEDFAEQQPAAETSSAGNEAAPLKVSDYVLNLSRIEELGQRTPQQRLMYALTVASLYHCRSTRIMRTLGLIFIPIALVAGMAAGFVAGWAVGWPLARIGLADASVVLLALLIAGLGLAFKHQEDAVELYEQDGYVFYFQLGRLNNLFDSSFPPAMAAILGICFGIQHALLMLTPGHFGLPLDGTFTECFLLSLDNACFGVFLDAFELYGINLGEPVEHTWYSATVFFAFRLMYEALTILIIYAYWKRYRMRRLFRSLPQSTRAVDDILDWIAGQCRNRNRWPTLYHDEFVFLLLCKSYVEGDDEYVRHLSRDMSSLMVEQPVRDLFRSRSGEVLFHPDPFIDED